MYYVLYILMNDHGFATYM